MRKRLKKKQLITKLFLLVILSTMTIGISYSQLFASLNIKGNVTGHDVTKDYVITSDSNPNLDIRSFTSNTTQVGNIERTNYHFNVFNLGNETINNFKLTITFNNILQNINLVGYEYTLNNNIVTIINSNGLKKSKSVLVDFVTEAISMNTKILTIKLEVQMSRDEVTLNELGVVFNITSSWGNYTYQYDIKVTNKRGKPINAWEIEVLLSSNTSYVSGWNARYQAAGNKLIISNAENNGKLKNNETTSLGLQLNTDIINFIPTIVRLSVR
ncbi:MAG: cellulose binding domain-containing protein [Bacilli bacterium]|nr:cellulose binding domain-containing protein [Bacilli bacterium]MDD4808703.1 cellulose binding domain-containing protein [Bacilli bacterium]